MAYSISCDCGNEITIPQSGYNSMNPLVIQVSCDGDTTNNSFTMDYYGDEGITINRNRNVLDVYVRPNLTQVEKNYTIYLTHSNDDTIYYQINLSQTEDTYNVFVDKNNITFQSGFYGVDNVSKEGDSSYYEEQLINVFVNGGSKKWKVKSIYRYHKSDDSTIDEKQTFDNGFIYTVVNSGLKLKNYGRPFMEEDDYYKITLCHKDDKNVTAIIQVNYAKAIQAKAKRKRKRGRRKIIKTYQNTNIYLPREEKKKLITAKISDNTEKTIYEIKFNKEIDDKIIIKGNSLNVNLPFKVLSNKEEMDLLTRIFKTSQWLEADLDDSNRNIVLSIKSKPICERKAYLRLEMVNYPEINKEFIVTNIPSE